MISLAKILESIRVKINPSFWNLFWLIAPATGIFFLPICIIFLRILAFLGLRLETRESEWIIYFIMLFSIIYGILIGVTGLLLANKLEVPSNLVNKIKCLAGFSIVTPIFIVMILLWAFCC